MSIDIGGTAVSGPPSVANAEAASGQWFLSQQLLQIAKLACLFGDMQRLVCHDGNARRVITPVLETSQTLDNDVQRELLTDVPDDSTHRRNCTFPRPLRWRLRDPRSDVSRFLIRH
jgi:hypothetical protein